MKSLSDIVDGIHSTEANGLTKAQITAVVKAAFTSVGDALKGSEEVSIAGFGKFSVVERAERMGRNPQSGAQQLIKASKNVKFKASKTLKDTVV